MRTARFLLSSLGLIAALVAPTMAAELGAPAAANATLSRRLPAIDSLTNDVSPATQRWYEPVGARQTSAPDIATVNQSCSSCQSGCGLDSGVACEDCPRFGLYAFVDFDSWKGQSDAGSTNNGLSSGLNFGTRLGRFSDWTDIGFQIGGSVGAFNWNGTDSHVDRQDQPTMQGFVTGGFFHKANERSHFNGALVQDVMVTSNYGVFAQNPTLLQWRAQLGYVLTDTNEIGLWGTWNAQVDTRSINGFGEVRWRAVQQLNAYWHHKWGPQAADTWIWFGVPENERLAGRGNLGDYLVGLLANVPLSDRLMLYTMGNYLHPSGGSGGIGSADEAWNFTIGLAFYPGRNARTETVAGQCWMPLLPVANNGYFLVDTNRTP